MRSGKGNSTASQDKARSGDVVARPVSTGGRKGTYEHVTTNNPVDQHVGRRVRERRLLLGLSQNAVAQQIGVTGQQYQKYEKGENRISASRLFDLANTLKVPVSHFFDDMADATKGSSPAHILSGAPAIDVDIPVTPSYARRQTLELLRLWQQLPDHARGRVVDLVRSMVDLSSEAQSAVKVESTKAS